MSDIKFSREQLQQMQQALSNYLQEELNVELGQFECEFLLEFVSKQLGAHFYNKGLQDAQALLLSRIDDLQYAIDELEKPTDQ